MPTGRKEHFTHAKTKLEKIAGIEKEIRRLENRRKQLVQEKRRRSARTGRNPLPPHSPTLATGNPHAHVMLTMCPFEESGEWTQSRLVDAEDSLGL